VTETAKRKSYGVKLVRGPFVRLPPHPEVCDNDTQFLALANDLKKAGHRLAADLFAGAGGLSLGLEQAGWRVVLAADHDPEAVETHRHHFGGYTLDWDLSDSDRVDAIASLISAAGVDLLVGGPPCQPFSRAGRYKIRHRVRNGLRDPHDERRDLWRSFLEVVRKARPPAVLMENVPDMALDKEMFILRAMVHDLERLGYAVKERVVDAWRYGVPQFRQRLILVALAGGIDFQWPDEIPGKVTVSNAISDLPDVKGGWRPEGGADGWAPYDQPVTAFQKLMRTAVPPTEADRVYDHITRPVREDDEQAFELMDSSTRYTQLPEEFRRYRADIFQDKYKRLEEHGLSRTITAHIAKDGYWYIHPRQNRTLTVREAARLQTFPDHFRFAGPPTAAFRQIGNAVPPLLGNHLGRAVIHSLDRAQHATTSTTEVARLLAEWFDTAPTRTLPWLRATTRWQVLSGEILLDRAPVEHVRHLWPLLQRWQQPVDTLDNETDVLEVGKWVSRAHRAGQLMRVAQWLQGHPGQLDEDATARKVHGVHKSVIDLAILVVPTTDEDHAEEPVLVTKGVLRVAARVTGQPVDLQNRLTDGRLAMARLVGDGSNARRAHLGVIELANSLCRSVDPMCTACPLAKLCPASQADRPPPTLLF
jgi:DNA (cytosine-5)-methyltransferase 1